MSNKKRNIVNRNMTEIKSGKYVQIGEELAHDTEYVGDILSTYSEDGKIFSGVAGILKVNKKKRKISVKSYNDDKRSTPKKGDWIIGTIDYIRKYSLGVNVNVLNNRLLIESGIYANIHISKASGKYIKNLEDLFQKNDIVRAKIIGKQGNEWRLASNIPKSGIIYTECKFCGHEMKRIGHDKVLCPFCDNTERKVLAPDYGDVRTKLEY